MISTESETFKEPRTEFWGSMALLRSYWRLTRAMRSLTCWHQIAAFVLVEPLEDVANDSLKQPDLVIA